MADSRKNNDKLTTKQYRYSPLTRYGRLLLRKVNRAIDEFGLLVDGDRVCVAVSGGKDSLGLLYLLLEHRRFYNVDFSVSAVHTVSDYNPNAERTRDYLEGLFRDIDIDYAFKEIEITRDEEGNEATPDCFLCAWKRREALFRYCVDTGATKLALGHHADDVAETTLLNLVYHGTLETMLPRRSFFDGKFDVVRPLFYIRENDLARYARMAGFDTSTCACPNEDTSKRAVMKDVLRGLRKEARQLNSNLWKAAKSWHDAYGDLPLHTKRKHQGRRKDTKEGR